METSLPSKKMVIVDVPDVQNLRASFRYNFFTKDERVNDRGDKSTTAFPSPTSAFAESDDYNRRTARYVKLNWKPVVSRKRPDYIYSIAIKDNIAKVIDEREFSTGDFSQILFQDTGLDGKVAFYIRKAIEKLNPTTSNDSVLGHAQTTNRSTNQGITTDFLATGLNNPQELGVSFADGSSAGSWLEELKNVGLNVKINSKVLEKTLSSVAKDAVSPFADEVASFLDRAKAIQTQAQSSKDSSMIREDDYDNFIRDYVTVKTIDTKNYDLVLQPIGYIVDKWEVTEQGLVPLSPMYLENPIISTTVDVKVKYGSRYAYKMRAVSYVETFAQEEDSEQMLVIGFLVASTPSPSVMVDCEEYTAPPAPSDFLVVWDHQKECTRLTWSFPPNSQQDIKKFQIFKRNNIEEPFQLVAMYDFDDSVVKSPYNETPNNNLVTKTTTPVLFHYDRKFTRESKCIYSLCSIDAHGITSNYSMQLEVSYDKFKNRTRQKLISVAGAPKSYPNVFLNVDTFVDSIKTEGYSKLAVYFNPEFLSVRDGQGRDLHLIKTGIEDTYKIQLLNLDLQVQQIIKVKLENRS